MIHSPDSRGTRRSSEEGFTLIEALIAIIILAFGLIAVTNLLLVAASSNSIANTGTATAAEASEAMERLKSVDMVALCAVAVKNGTVGSLANDAGTANGTPSATPDIFVGGALTFHMYRALPGVGVVRTRWTIFDPGASLTPTLFLTVESQAMTTFGRDMSKAQFTAFRTCTGNGCNFPC